MAEHSEETYTGSYYIQSFDDELLYEPWQNFSSKEAKLLVKLHTERVCI